MILCSFYFYICSYFCDRVRFSQNWTYQCDIKNSFQYIWLEELGTASLTLSHLCSKLHIYKALGFIVPPMTTVWRQPISTCRPIYMILGPTVLLFCLCVCMPVCSCSVRYRFITHTCQSVFMLHLCVTWWLIFIGGFIK